MLQALFNYFYNQFQLFFTYNELNLEDSYLQTDVGFGIGAITWTEYLSFICSLISLIIIVTLCCLFIGKLVKGVAHLMVR